MIEGYEKMRGGKPVTFWRDDALEAAAGIVEAYGADSQIAADIRAMKGRSAEPAVAVQAEPDLDAVEISHGARYADMLRAHPKPAAPATASINTQYADAEVRDASGKLLAVVQAGEHQARMLSALRSGASAQPAGPLTDQQIVDALKACDKEDHTQEGWIWRQRIKWARAIEAAHGITGGAQ